ncbi:MAG: Hybrid sensor [Myxococcales bacterium]|nr:Hybrid sensor [Myxococcales bacterium]
MRAPVGVAGLRGGIPSRRASVRFVTIVATLFSAGCPRQAVTPPPSAPAIRPPSFTASRVRAFSDSLAVTSVADSPASLFVGTPRGLVRWDGATRYTVLAQRDGLPADRIAAVAVDATGGVWVATAKGLSRGVRNAWTNYAVAPVGGFLTGLQSDGKVVWAGGPEGLARLHNGKWEHFFADTGITAIAAGPGGTLWVGTSGAGVLRIAKNGEKLDHFTVAQGCETDVVRGLVAVDRTLLVVGEGAAGARAAFFDGERFHSYELTSPSVIEWAARAGARTLVGAGDHIYSITLQSPTPAGEELPAAAAVKLAAIAGWVAAPRPVALKPDLPSTWLDVPAAAAQRPKPPPPAPPVKGKSAIVAAPPAGPPFVVEESPLHLPDGVTAVGGSERGLLVGTRFLGALRIENDVPRQYRINDLASGAVRLTVACVTSKDGADDCFLATGGTRAWRFDGQAFEIAAIDPEQGSRILAILRDDKGDVLAIHRGAEDRQLRLSRVDAGRWTPIGMQPVVVPQGAPELNFAAFAPDGHLWVGLRYVDKEGDARDWGADEIDVFSGKVIPHKELPTDVVAMYWKAKNEAWFATRSGAARLLDGHVRVFTENDGMASDITRDIGPGSQPGEIFVATGRGTGRFDGTRWTFPRLGAFYHSANALAHDAHGNVFIGTDKGLFCVGECAPDAIDIKRGLVADVVKDLAVDGRNRVWVLTEKGINIVEP